MPLILLIIIFLTGCMQLQTIIAEFEAKNPVREKEELGFSIVPPVEEEQKPIVTETDFQASDRSNEGIEVDEIEVVFPVRNKQPSGTLKDKLINPEGNTVRTRINPPEGFVRAQSATSFGDYLRDLPLKEDGAKVHYYDGTLKSNDVYVAVVDMDVGKRDLQQCADAVMRLRAEYLYQSGQYDAIHFNFTNGFNAKYSKWRAGNRIKVKGNKVSWYAGGAKTTKYSSFRKYMNMVFAYAGTLSLSKELKPVSLSAIRIGDVFIKGGSPGHAVIVVDMAVNKYGEKVFLLAQSYMPAQEIQILKNPQNRGLSPWYKADFETLYTPEWTFEVNQLKRF